MKMSEWKPCDPKPRLVSRMLVRGVCSECDRPAPDSTLCNECFMKAINGEAVLRATAG